MLSAVCDKVFECTEHSADQNLSSAVPRLWPHTAWQSTQLLKEFGWEVFNRRTLNNSDLAPRDFHLFLHLKKLASAFSERQRGGDECHSGSNPRQQTLTTQDTIVGLTV